MEIKRDQYLKKLINKKDNNRIKIITGIRRSGKSYLLFKIYKRYLIENGIKKNNIIEIALDELENIIYRNPFELDKFIRSKIKDTKNRYYIFIDEIQFSHSIKNPYSNNSDEKITFVETLLGLMKIDNIDIYITGSNSKMLSKDILTQFRDRGDEIHVTPLSFSEVYNFYQDKDKAWRDYFIFGGMPYIFSLNTNQDRSNYLKNLIKETYIKDIVERNNIQNDVYVLEILLDFISSSIGSLTNPSKLARRFLSEKKINISHSTILRYLTYFEEAYIINSSKRYDIKGSKYFTTPLKYYFSDIGIRNARLNFRQVEENHIMENIIYNDLINRGYNVDVGVVEYNKENKRVQLEVDFIVNNIDQRYYIQSALSISDEDKRLQEINSLKRINDSFRKIIIVKDDIIPWYDDMGIYYIGVKDFLLSKNIFDI